MSRNTAALAKLPTYDVRNTHQLQVGDVVNCHGSKFRLTERRGYDSGVVQFSCEYLGPMYPHDPGCESIPEHWRGDWLVQGNERASWAVVLLP